MIQIQQEYELFYKATSSEWQRFLESNVWNDLQLFILDRIEFNRNNLELTEEERQVATKVTNNVYESADILRGRNREARDILLAPGEILKELGENTDDRRDDT